MIGSKLAKLSISVLLLLLLLGALSIGPFLNSAAARVEDGPSDPSLYSDDWRSTGPPGGDVRALVVDPNDADRFYFGTLDGQIYASTDGARSWRLLHNFSVPRL